MHYNVQQQHKWNFLTLAHSSLYESYAISGMHCNVRAITLSGSGSICRRISSYIGSSATSPSQVHTSKRYDTPRSISSWT